MADTGTVSIHGKIYKTVALRIEEFRNQYPGHGVETELLSQAELVTVKASITNEEGRVIATGYAEEDRSASKINKTSAVENAETSAVGRALAFLGLAGTEIASADEVHGAINQQAVKEAVEDSLSFMNLVREHFESIGAIKNYLAEEMYSHAVEALYELDESVMKALWKAPSKGGVFTTHERKQMQSDEFAQARRAHFGDNDEN